MTEPTNKKVAVPTPSKQPAPKTVAKRPQQTDKVVLPETIFNVKPNTQAIFDVIMAERAALRSGNHQTKDRSEVRGGGIKPWKQKGTGRARAGSNRSPIWVGGGVTFGPTNQRNYQLSVNKKVRKLALKSALTLKAKAAAVMVKDIKMTKPSTKDFINLLNDFKLKQQPRKVLIVTDDAIVLKSLANLQHVYARKVTSLAVEAVVNADLIIMSQAHINQLAEVLK